MIKKLSSFIISAMMTIGFLASSTFASLPFNDSRSLTLNSGVLTLYMGQSGSSFYLDSVNISGKPLSCEIKAGTILIQRNNCDDASFYYNGSSDIKIYVQLDNDQGTWTYNTSSKTFTDARRGTQDVTDYDDDPVYTNGYISLSTNGSSFDLSEYIDLSVRVYNGAGNTDTSNRDQIRFTILKQSGSAYYNASSSDYYLKNTYYTFTSSDRGYVTLSNYLRFYNSGTYKIRVENTSTGRTSETIVYIGNSGSSNNSVYSLGVSVSRTNPSLNQYVDTTVTARDRNGNRVYTYIGTVRYVVEKRDNNSSFWYSASSSDYTLSVSSRYIGPNQNGTITVSDHLRFRTNGNYRLRVYDSADSSISGYQEFTIGNSGGSTSNNNVYRFVGSLSPNIPELYDNISMNILAKDTNNATVTNMSDRVTISLERKLLPTSTLWTKTVPLTTCKLNITSYTFSSSDYGQVNLNTVVRCTKKGFYRLKITNAYNENVVGYVYFTIVDTNDFVKNLAGFTNSQRQEVQEEYRTFMAQVNEWEAQYPNLAYNTKWNTLWKNYYNVLNKLAYNKSGRVTTYAAYEKIRDTFMNSFYTIR